MPCSESRGYWIPTCACALVFQAGRDIYLINHCEGAHFNGFLLAGDDIMNVYEIGDTRYQVSNSHLYLKLLKCNKYKCCFSHSQ